MVITAQFVRYVFLLITICASVTINAVKYGISDLEQSQKLDTVIELCDNIRKEKNANIALPHEFNSWFAELTKYAKDMCDKGNRIPYLSSHEECHKKVEKIIAQEPKTIYEWNLINYQLVLLFDAINGMVSENTNHVPEKERGIVLAALDSRETTERLIIDSGENMLKGATRELLTPSDADGFEYCPIATPFNIGIEWINHAFARGIAPLGVSLKPLYYDGAVNGPLRFFIHDGFHYRAWLTQALNLVRPLTKPEVFALIFENKEYKYMRIQDIFSKRELTEKQKALLFREREINTNFVNFLDKFKGEYQRAKLYNSDDGTMIHNGEPFQCTENALSLALFRANHEESFHISDLDRICERKEIDRPTYIAFPQLLSRSHSNELLPKNLQHGLDDFADKFDKFMLSIAASKGYIVDLINRFLADNDAIAANQINYNDVSTYAINADGCLCQAWKQFRSSYNK